MQYNLLCVCYQPCVNALQSAGWDFTPSLIATGKLGCSDVICICFEFQADYSVPIYQVVWVHWPSSRAFGWLVWSIHQFLREWKRILTATLKVCLTASDTRYMQELSMHSTFFPSTLNNSRCCPRCRCWRCRWLLLGNRCELWRRKLDGKRYWNPGVFFSSSRKHLCWNVSIISPSFVDSISPALLI